MSTPNRSNSLSTRVVTTSEEMTHVYAIRAICYMEDGLTAQQAFDGNDLQATHVLVYNGDEPIGAARVRWFAGFAKIERTAFRPAYRNVRVLRASARFIFEHAAAKGYTCVITHAAPLYARLWQKVLGFQPIPGRPEIAMGALEPHVELIKHLDIDPDAISLETDPTILSRIEGAWDRPTSFEATTKV